MSHIPYTLCFSLFSVVLLKYFCQPIVSLQILLLCAGAEVLQAGVEGPCLHKPENWLVRQLNDEPKLVYKVRFIREKGQATVKVLQWSLEAGNPCSAKGWGFYGHFNSGLGGFLIGLAFQGLS
jgi:hypothetical protein